MNYKKNVTEQIENMDDDYLIETLNEILNDSNYQENNFTHIMQSIAKYYKNNSTITDKQRNAVKLHLEKFPQCWY